MDPCSEDSPYKICLPVYDGYLSGVCVQDNIRPTPEEPVLSFVYYGPNENNTILSLRYDIPNNPLRINDYFLILEITIFDVVN